MKRFVGVIGSFLVLACAAQAGESAIRNGDFSKGKIGWNVERTMRVISVAEADGSSNKVMLVMLDGNATRTLSARFDIKSKTKVLHITFRVKPCPGYKSATPDGNQMTLRFVGPSSTTFTSRRLAPKDEWQNFDFDIWQFAKSRTFTFNIEFHPATGELWVDDVVAAEK
jgi:hypothetical protein